MEKSISLKAIKWDIQHLLEQNPYVARNLGLTLSVLLMLFIMDDFLEIVAFGGVLLITILWHFREYWVLNKKSKIKEVIFFKKKKNERVQHLYIFFITIFFAWMAAGNASWLLFMLGISVFYLIKYLFFIPSIIFKAEDYSLLIERGFRRIRVDFTYTNRVRFVSHQMIFENVIDKKVVVKDIEYLTQIDELKAFLSNNFGREKVVSAANGQSLI